MISYPIKNKTKTQKAKSKNWVVPEKIHTSPTNGILEILTGGGGQGPRKSRRKGGLNSKESSAGVISTDSSRN